MSRLERRIVFSQMVPERDVDCTPDIFMVSGFGNTGVIITDEGVVIVDNTPMTSERVIKSIRERTKAPIHSIINTHGHADHAFATASFIEDARQQGHPRPRVIGHDLLPKRFDRYKTMAQYNRYINGIQSGRSYMPPPPDVQFLPPNIVYPDITFSDAMQFRLGDLTFELYHYMGETDDGTWVWVPKRKTAIVGDLMTGVCPNVGNPFKVQRYTLEWAEGLESVAGKNPDFLIPGHGRLLKNKEIQTICLDTAKLMRYIHDEVIRLLNEGCWIEEIIQRIKIPEELANKRWLAPVYGCPTYIIHGVHRRYAGWYNGNPSELFSSNSTDIAIEVAGICGVDALIKHAKKLQEAGNTQLALNVLDFAVKGTQDPTNRKAALQLKAQLLDQRAEIEVNTIAKNIFLVGAEQAEQEANSL